MVNKAHWIKKAVLEACHLLLRLRQRQAWTSRDWEAQAQVTRVQERPERARGEVANGLTPSAHREPRGPRGMEELSFHSAQDANISRARMPKTTKQLWMT